MGTPSNAAARASAVKLPIRPGPLGDERLAQLVGEGSERAFATIYERYHQRLYGYCYSVLRDRDDAYDALQSTLLRAFAALRRGQRDAPLRPWLFRIAHNEAISLIGRRRAVREPADTPESCVPSAEDRAGERARLALLVADLRQLSERERSVLLMRELSGLSHRDIAVALGISIHTVKHALFAARRSLGEFEEGRAMVCKDVRRSISYADGSVLPRARAHLRDCAACAAFAAAIPTRRADLQALAPPLPAVSAAGLLAGLHGAASTPAAGGGGGVAAAVAGKTAGAALAVKALAGVAVVAIAGASVTGAVSAVKHDANQRSVGQTTRLTRAGTVARHGQRPVGAHSSRGRHSGAPVDVPGGRPTGAISGAPVPSTGNASGTPGGSGALPNGASARELRPAREVGTASPTGNGSRRGGGRSGVAEYPRGSGARSVAGAKHGGGPGGRSGVAANDGSHGRPEGQSRAEGTPRNSGGTSVAEGHPGGPPASASETSPSTAAEAVSGPPQNTQGGQQPHSAAQAQPNRP